MPNKTALPTREKPNVATIEVGTSRNAQSRARWRN
jgi:hypothetical protein